MATIVKASTITPNGGTGHMLLGQAAADVAHGEGTYVYRVWEVDPATREYLFDTGTNNYEPVCVFPQPEVTR